MSIMSGSYSRLIDFESCPLKAKFKYVDKIQLPKEDKETPLDRGSRIHQYAEDFVRGKIELAHELRNFEKEYLKLNEEFDAGRVELEQMWCYDRGWCPVDPDDFANTFVRIKVDALWNIAPGRAVVIDYKTGKRVGNEVKHNEQLLLYQLGAFLRDEALQQVDVELWYLDQNEVPPPKKFKRAQGLKFLKNFNQRMLDMVTATEFPARPSVHNCMFCPYKTGQIGKRGPQGTGNCSRNPI